MNNISKEMTEIELLSYGFSQNKREDTYSARVMAGCGKISAKQGYQISDIATKYGNGEILFNNMHSIDIIGIPKNNIKIVSSKLSDVELKTGGLGNRIRPIFGCQATVCKRSLLDSFNLGEKLQQLFCIRYLEMELPNSFQISLSGCSRDCSQSKISDLGIVAYTDPNQQKNIPKDLCYKVYVGGRTGEHIEEGLPFRRMIIGEEALLSVIDRTISVYRTKGHAKETMRMLIDRVGFKEIEDEIFA